MDFEQMSIVRTAFIKHVRDFSEEQKEIWQLVPWLALQADGRTGGMGLYHSAYERGLWHLYTSNSRYARAYVDCATGRIYADYLQFSLATDDHVLELAKDLTLLSAAYVCEQLREKVREPRPSYIGIKEWELNESRRLAIAARLGLTERYVRQPRVCAAA